MVTMRSVRLGGGLRLALGLALLGLLATPRVGLAQAFVPVTDAAELAACIADPATPFCELTQSILFTGNQTDTFMDLYPPPDAMTHLRCAPGVAIVWDNADGPPAFGVNVVRVTLSQRDLFIVEDCTVETRVAGDAEVGQDVSTQVFFARRNPGAYDTRSTVVIVRGFYKTAHYGSSTIALGCNCQGPSEWTLVEVVAEGPISLDAKGRTTDAVPLDWVLLDTELIARPPATGDLRCLKQEGTVRFASMEGSSCTRGTLSFSPYLYPQEHDLDDFTFKDAPWQGVPSGALIIVGSPHSFEGEIRVEGAPGDGDPTDNRTQNILFSLTGVEDVDLEIEYDACHRTFSPEPGKGDFALDLRPGPVGDIELELEGPSGCGAPTEFWDGRTLQTLAENESDGHLITSSGVSFELEDGIPVPEPSATLGLALGSGLIVALSRRRRRERR